MAKKAKKKKTHSSREKMNLPAIAINNLHNLVII